MRFQDYIFSRAGELRVDIEGWHNSVRCDIGQGLAKVPISDLKKEITKIEKSSERETWIWLSDQSDPDYIVIDYSHA